jgi:hypothetical protein
MYCTECGRKLDGGAYCSGCGKKVEPENNGQAYNPQQPPINTGVMQTYTQKKQNRTVVFAVVALTVVFVISVFIRGGSHGAGYQVPDGYTYSVPQGQLAPPDYSYDGSYFSYDGGDSSQICMACKGTGSCDICNGTGQYSMYGNELSECTACNGTGDCSICDGDGYN